MLLSLWNQLTLTEIVELEQFCDGPLTNQMVLDKIATRTTQQHRADYREELAAQIAEARTKGDDAMVDIYTRRLAVVNKALAHD